MSKLEWTSAKKMLLELYEDVDVVSEEDLYIVGSGLS